METYLLMVIHWSFYIQVPAHFSSFCFTIHLMMFALLLFTGLVPGDFIHVVGDAHVYRNHVRPLQDQLQKLPRPFPVLKINPQKKDIESFVAADFELTGYDPHQRIEMKMAI
uniref:Bifunctional dihydrofolate reductase-thymidylate synthase n=1 Tax=Solanum tuberosum TaxID=4113 RepID=M0ZJD2_SOLTU